MKSRNVVGVLIAIVLLGGLIAFWMRGTATPDLDVPGGESGEGEAQLVDASPHSSPGPGAEGEGEEATEAAAEEEDLTAEVPPLLRGRVVGEGAGIGGARVFAFSLADVERMLRRFERLVPEGGGVPDIPRIVRTVREELDRFRAIARTFTTDEEGWFEARDIEPTTHLLLTLAGGWLFRYGDVVALAEGETREVTLELERGEAIRGLVVDPSGAALPDVEVFAEYRPPGAPGLGRIIRRALTYVNGEFLRGPFLARSAPDGAFSLTSLPPGAYDLVATCSDGRQGRLPGVMTGADRAVLVLGPAARIEGTFLTPEGAPAAGIAVKLVPLEERIELPIMMVSFTEVANLVYGFLGDPSRTTVSGPDGVFRFAPLGAGGYRLSVEQPGWIPWARDVRVEWGERSDLGVVRLDPGRSIEGVVRSPDGLPLDEARVLVTPASTNPLTMGVAIKDLLLARLKTVTGPDGRFRVRGVGSGAARLTVSRQGFAPAVRPSVTPGSGPIDIVLERGSTVEGRVVDARGGEPVADARIHSRGVSTRSDADGRFRLDGVVPRDPAVDRLIGGGGGGFRPPASAPPEGGYPLQVRVEAKGYVQEKIPIQSANAGDFLDVRLEPTPELRGVVLGPGGEPLPAALVRLVPDAGEEFRALGLFDTDLMILGVSTTDLKGAFSLARYFAPEEETPLQLIADHPLYARGRSERIWLNQRLEGGGEIEIRLASPAVVRGTVSAGGEPVVGATVRLARPRAGAGGPQAMFFAMAGLPPGGETTRTNAEGKYVFQKVLPGEWTLKVEARDYVDSEPRPLSIAEGAESVVDFALERGGELAGRVEDPSGVGLAGARVRLLREDGLDERARQVQRVLGGALQSTRADEEGAYLFSGLPPGEYTLVGELDGYGKAMLEKRAPGEKLPALVLVAGAELRGRVVDGLDGEPVTEFRIDLHRSDREADGVERFLSRMGGFAVSDAQGAFVKKDVEPGEYEVSVRASGYVPVREKLQLASGVALEREYALTRAGRVRGRVVDGSSGRPVAGARVALAREPRPAAAPAQESPRERHVGKTARFDSGAEGGSGAAGPGRPAEEGDREAMRRFFAQSALVDAVVTDGDGLFTIQSVPPEPQTVVVTHPEYIQAYREGVEVPLGEEVEVSFRLASGLVASGRVVDSRGDGVPGRFILLRGAGGGNERVTKSATTGPDGGFRFAGLNAGEYRIVAPTPGESDRQPSIDVGLRDDRRDLELAVPEQGS